MLKQSLLADARPIRLKLEDQSDIPKNFTIFSASELDQISSGLKEAKHGIFSYYVMKGLEGDADINSDKKITNGELLSYLKDHVPLKASELGIEQTPSLIGDPDKRIKEDYLRILRYVRFYLNYSKLKHKDEVKKTIKKNISGLSKISSDRLLNELNKLIKSEKFLNLYKDDFCLEIVCLMPFLMVHVFLFSVQISPSLRSIIFFL